jgi:hypothetical protein
MTDDGAVARHAKPNVVWINGAFGVGKSTVASELAATWPNPIVFDPEVVGAWLPQILPAELRAEAFQDSPLWRRLIVEIAAGLAVEGRRLIVPMTLVVPGYFDEIVGGLRDRGIRVDHETLRAAGETIRAQLRARPDSTPWAFEQVGRCVAGLVGPRFGTYLDADRVTPVDLAAAIAAIVEESDRHD